MTINYNHLAGPPNNNLSNLNNDLTLNANNHVLKICTLNSCSIKPPNPDRPIIPIHENLIKLDNLATLSKELDLDILCLTETWLNGTIDNGSIKIENFQEPFRNDRSDSYGGVAIYVRNQLKAIRRIDFERGESVVLEISSNQNRNKIFVACIYRPPKNNLPQFRSFMSDLNRTITELQNICSNSDQIILTGDFNVHCDRWWNGSKRTTAGDLFSTDLLNCGMEQIVNFPTYALHDYRALLDLVITNRKDLVCQIEPLAPLTSNMKHFPVYTEILWKSKRSKTKRRKMYYFNRIDNISLAAMNNYFSETLNWTGNHTLPTNEIVLMITQTIEDTINRYVPHKIIETNNKDPDWLKSRPSLKQRLKKRHKLFRKLYGKGRPSPSIDQVNEYTNVAQQLDLDIKHAKETDIKIKAKNFQHLASQIESIILH